jgi:uncharacterized protein YqeY
MSLTDTINADIKTAMLAKDEAGLRGLRAIKSALIIAKTSGANAANAEEEEIKMLQKLVKQRKESAEIYQGQNRADLAQKELDEIAVIEKYLPKQMSEDEVRAIVKHIIESTGAKSPADMGKVMGAASKQLAGKADNKVVSSLVKELLSGV